VDFVLSATNMIVPLPSVGAMVSHRFGMRDDLTAYHLGGQGCAAGVLILQLAQTLLKVRPG
jgi:3-ketoacyl-CoA synthase